MIRLPENYTVLWVHVNPMHKVNSGLAGMPAGRKARFALDAKALRRHGKRQMRSGGGRSPWRWELVMSRTLVNVGIGTLLGISAFAPAAAAQSCLEEIVALQNQLPQPPLDAPLTGPYGTQSVGAQLSHDPTPARSRGRRRRASAGHRRSGLSEQGAEPSGGRRQGRVSASRG